MILKVKLELNEKLTIHKKHPALVRRSEVSVFFQIPCYEDLKFKVLDIKTEHSHSGQKH